MTQKRYTFDIDNENGFDEPYFCNGTDSFYVNNADEMELFIKEMNDLADENTQYQEWLDALREELSLADRDNTALEKENKELKQLIKKVMEERVVDYPLLCKLKEMVKE